MHQTNITTAPSVATHQALMNRGLSWDRAYQIITNQDLSFKPIPMGVAENYRAQLKAIAENVDVNINNLLAMLSGSQIEAVVEEHKGIKMFNPNTGKTNLTLTDINAFGKKWLLQFKLANGQKTVFELHDLEIQDVLGLLATIENTISPLHNEAKN